MTISNHWLLLALALPSAALAADPATSVRGLIAKNKADSAQSKCTKWNAQSPSSDSELREACAEAFWVRAEDVNTVAAWMAWREAWDGTKKAPEALEREAERALFTVPVSAPEADFLVIAKDYDGTKAGETAKSKAANAAFLRVNSEEEAIRVCEAYSSDPKLPDLVQRYLGAFIEVRFDGKTTDVQLAECASLPEGVELTTNWVTKDANGRFSSWNQTARDTLVAGGLAESFVDPMVASAPEGKPAFPVCFDANLPEGVEVGVQISAGKGSTFMVAPWNQSCNEQTAPVFAVVSNGQLSALSLRPGHVVSMGTAADAEPGGFFPTKPGAATLVDGKVVQKVQDGMYYVQPLSGANAWWLLTSSHPKGSSVLPLTADLKQSRLPTGWQVQSTGSSSSVAGPGLTQAWVLPAGESRALSPLVQRVTGLTRDYEGLSTERAAPLPDPASTPWTVPALSSAAVEAAAAMGGPQGSMSSPVTALDEYTRGNAGAGLAQAGLTLEVVRAWEVQLDADGPKETLWEATWGTKGMRFLSDPMPSGLVRVFPSQVGTAEELIAADTRAFAFKVGDISYVATATPGGTGLELVEALHLSPTGLEREVVRVQAPSSN